ncbi:MAG: hypothetical protein K8R88_06615, partial [Armatimonadetes bacterium]|nr:hypothetical protein [Armatimonadota bacterium]
MGAETFRSAKEFIERHDARIIVAAVPPAVMEVLKEVPDVKSQLPMAPTVEAARASLNILNEHVDHDDHHAVGKKKKSVAVTGQVMVILSGSRRDPYLLDVAADFALSAGAAIVLMFPILVPRELPLQSPLAEEEANASRTIMEAESKCADMGIHFHKEISRARDLGSAIDEGVKDNPVAAVFVGLSADPEMQQSDLQLVKSVLSKVSEPVYFIRGKKL